MTRTWVRTNDFGNAVHSDCYAKAIAESLLPTSEEPPKKVAAKLMPSLTDKDGQFYRRPDRSNESICMLCFLPIRSSKAEWLTDAENTHREECPNRPLPPVPFSSTQI